MSHAKIVANYYANLKIAQVCICSSYLYPVFPKVEKADPPLSLDWPFKEEMVLQKTGH